MGNYGTIFNFLDPQRTESINYQGVHAYFSATNRVVVIIIANIETLTGINARFIDSSLKDFRTRLGATDLG